MRRTYALATASNAVATLAPQLLALFTLGATEFGHFSLMYLAYAFGVSLSLSVISEPWHIKSLNGLGASWTAYAITAMTLGGAVGIAGGVAALFLTSSPAMSIAITIAIAAGVVRSGFRYYLVQQKLLQRALLGDLAFLFVFTIAAIALLPAGQEPLIAVGAAWACGGVASLAATPKLSGPPMGPFAWVRTHVSEIRRLLADSILMDIGAIFTPALIAPVLGATAFGTYRAISNVAAPVRLILNPLRPLITQQGRGAGAKSRRLMLAVVAAAFLLATTIVGALLLIELVDVSVGVLNSLTPFALAVGTTVGANFVGHYCYIRARSRFSARALLGTRLAQTGLVTGLPLGGALALGLSGAIWFSSAAFIAVAMLWAGMDYRQSRLAKQD